MKIVNLNENARKNLFQKEEYIKDLKPNIDKISKFYLEEMDFECKKDEYIAGLLYVNSYIYNIVASKYYPDAEDIKERLELLNKINSINEFTELLSEDFDLFTSLWLESVCFTDLDTDIKRLYYKKALEHKDQLAKVFPAVILDFLYFENNKDISFIEDEYNERLEKEEKEIAYEKTISYTVEKLIELEKDDLESYTYVILELAEHFYKYNKYLLDNGFLDESVEKNILDMIDENVLSIKYFSINNTVILKSLVSNYLRYITLEENELKEIEDFYKQSKKSSKRLKKIISISDNIKNGKL
jgi:hypothetical protein